MTSPDTVILTATNEVGYLEKSKSAYLKNPNILYDKTAGAGQDNYTKYGKEMHEISPKVMDFPAPWCDCFVDWCMYKSYGLETALKLLCGPFDDYTINSSGYYKKASKWINKDPVPGDQIFFKSSGKICHTGLVYKVDKRYVYTIEGNTSEKAILVSNGGCVTKKKYLLNYSGIAGYGRPSYDLRATCSIGDCNKDVLLLQKILMAKGYALPKYGADGDFGSETFNAVKQFRVENKLNSSGICDSNCWVKLLYNN